MTHLKSLFTFCCLISMFISSSLMADEASRIASLSKSDFLDEYKEIFVRQMEVNKALMVRTGAEFSNVMDTDTPISDKELAVAECLYDTTKKAGKLSSAAQYLLIVNELEAKVAANPTFDYIDLMYSDLMGNTVLDEAVTSAMVSCGTVQASADRVNFTPEFWMVLQQKAQERGYLDEDNQ
jgi:hypothetical protein